jgi:hypothetical protein
MERKYEIGQTVIFVDPKGRPHNALVTAWWTQPFLDHKSENSVTPMEGTAVGCNLVYVVSEFDKADPYGRQIERETSVTHKTGQPAPGMFWCWPDELGF